MSIITHKDGNNQPNKEGKAAHDKMSTNAEELKSTSSSENMKNDNNALVQKNEYGCHFVSRNPQFLASISYPSISQESTNVPKSSISAINKESRTRPNGDKIKDSTQMPLKKVILRSNHV